MNRVLKMTDANSDKIKMELSIVIVNWNTREYLRSCLASIFSSTPSVSFEVIVVDNASGDGSAEMVRECFKNVELIENDENIGYAEGNNQAIERSGGEYLLLLNPDTEVRFDTIDKLLEFARSHPDAAAVGCRLIGNDGRVQRSCRGFPEPWGVFCEYIGLSRLFPGSRAFGSYRMTYFDYECEAEVDQPMASCLLIPRKAIEETGLFDKEYPIFFNEVDWCYRAKKAGWKVYFTPEAEILHHGGASTRQKRPEMKKESHEALKRFYEKHYKQKISRPVYSAIMLAIDLNSKKASRLKSVDSKDGK